MTADSINLFFECDRSNSKAKIPHATVGRAAPTTNRRRESCTASLTCVTWAGSLVITAAAINTTHKMTPTAFRNIKALINRCPMRESIHDCDDHGNAAYHARVRAKGRNSFRFCYWLWPRVGTSFISRHQRLGRCLLGLNHVDGGSYHRDPS